MSFNKELEQRARNPLPYLPIIRRYFPKPEDTQDALQESFLNALERQDNFDPERGTFDSWFVRLVQNTCRDMSRKKKVRVAEVEEHVEVSEADYLIYRLDVKRAIERSNTKHPEIMDMYFLQGYAPSEIGEKLGININTVKQRVLRWGKRNNITKI